MEKIDYIPLGSVVYLKGGIKKLLVVARAIMAANGGKQYFFDYGGVLYPEGITMRWHTSTMTTSAAFSSAAATMMKTRG